MKVTMYKLSQNYLNLNIKLKDYMLQILIKVCCNCRFFRSYPYFQCMFPTLENLPDENAMRLSEEFEAQAMMMFALFDDVVESLYEDADSILEKLEDVARIHARLEGFHSEFFQVMFYIVLLLLQSLIIY